MSIPAIVDVSIPIASLPPWQARPLWTFRYLLPPCRHVMSGHSGHFDTYYLQAAMASPAIVDVSILIALGPTVLPSYRPASSRPLMAAMASTTIVDVSVRLWGPRYEPNFQVHYRYSGFNASIESPQAKPLLPIIGGFWAAMADIIRCCSVYGCGRPLPCRFFVALSLFRCPVVFPLPCGFSPATMRACLFLLFMLH